MLVVFDMVGERTKGTVDLVEEGRRSDVNELYRPKSGSGVMYAKCFAEGGPGCSGSSTIEILMNEKIIYGGEMQLYVVPLVVSAKTL